MAGTVSRGECAVRAGAAGLRSGVRQSEHGGMGMRGESLAKQLTGLRLATESRLKCVIDCVGGADPKRADPPVRGRRPVGPFGNREFLRLA
jgi:hypothetical protein